MVFSDYLSVLFLCASDKFSLSHCLKDIELTELNIETIHKLPWDSLLSFAGDVNRKGVRKPSDPMWKDIIGGKFS